MTVTSQSATTRTAAWTARSLPRGVARARAAMAVVAVLLTAWFVITVATHVGAAVGGNALVFSQDGMTPVGVGPAPMEGEPGVGEGLPADDAVGGTQQVDLPSLGVVLLGALVAGAGALLVARRSRWSVPAGLAGMGVVAAAAAFPALVAFALMDTYSLVAIGDVAGFFVVAAVLVGLALLGVAAVWRHRHELGPVSG